MTTNTVRLVSKSARRTQQNRHRLIRLAAAVAIACGVAFAGSEAKAQTTFSYTGPAVPIPDAGDFSGTSPGAPALAPLTISGMTGVITKVVFRFDGIPSTAVGNTGVGLDHTFVNDLEITLISPNATSVLLINNTDGSGNNFAQTILDDAAPTSIQSAVTANAPFNATWAPNSPLAAFNGEDPNGVWLLQVQDFFSQDTGNIRLFSLIITTGFLGPITGPIIQNSAPVGVLTTADFIVDGAVQTAGPTENNTVNSLTFLPGSSLQIFSTLFVTSGPVNLVPTASIHLDGTLSASQLNVLFGGLLNGNGTIDGNLYNNGVVAPGNSPGEIIVSGDYVQGPEGTLEIEIAGRRSGEFDLLSVYGSASLDGTLRLIRLDKFKLKRGDKITFLTAGEGVEGEFAHVESDLATGTILEGSVLYEEDQVSVVAEGSYGDFAAEQDLTPNQRAVAGALDEEIADGASDELISYLDYRKLEDLPGDFDRLAPEELTSVFTLSTSLANVQGLNLQRRTDDLRSGASGFSAGGLAMQGSGPGYSGSLFGVAGPTGKEVKETKDVLPEEKKWGVFLTGVGEWIDVGSDGNARGYDITTGGFTLGLDYKVSPNFAVGLAAGYAGTGIDLTDDGRVWVNGGKLGLYATYFTGGFYVDAAVTGGLNSYDTKRSAIQGAARGSTDGGELNVLLGTGYDWKIGALSIGPTATFQYTLVGIDGFTERGSLAPLNIADRNAESVRTAFGFKASYDWKCGGVVIKPELRAAWQHEYGDKTYDLSASFAGGGGNSFLVNGPEIGRDSLLIGAGFAVQLNERTATYLYYDGELGRDQYDRHSVSGGIRIAF